MNKVVFFTVVTVFAIFVWPTPYRELNQGRKVNRIAWALNRERARPEVHIEDAWVWAFASFGGGVLVGITGFSALNSIKRRRLKADGPNSVKRRPETNEIRKWVIAGAAGAVGCTLILLDSDDHGFLTIAGVLLVAPLIGTALAAGWQWFVRYLIER